MQPTELESKPLHADRFIVAIDKALQQPRAQRLEVLRRAGVLKSPAVKSAARTGKSNKS